MYFNLLLLNKTEMIHAVTGQIKLCLLKKELKIALESESLKLEAKYNSKFLIL